MYRIEAATEWNHKSHTRRAKKYVTSLRHNLIWVGRKTSAAYVYVSTYAYAYIYTRRKEKKKPDMGRAAEMASGPLKLANIRVRRWVRKKGGWKDGRSHEKRIVQTNLWLLGQIVSSGSGVPKMERTWNLDNQAWTTNQGGQGPEIEVARLKSDYRKKERAVLFQHFVFHFYAFRRRRIVDSKGWRGLG